jgi:tetratricopeptide (TPR) repeat protein
MTRFIFILTLSLFLQTSNANAAISVLGDSEAAICYKHAKLGYSSRSSINICLNTLSDMPLPVNIRDATRINLGIIYNNGLKPNLALEQFEMTILNESVKAETLLNQGNSLYLLKDFNGALKKYNDALDLGINDISAVYYNKGLVFEKLGNTEEAVLFYKKAISLNPKLMSIFDKRLELNQS